MAIITISRGTKSGGETLADCLARRLQYSLVGREILQEAASKLGVSEEAVARKLEHTPKLWGRHSSTRRLYVAVVQAALAEHVAGGDLVYHGLAGQLLLRGVPTVLRLRLIAPIETRVRALIETHRMHEESARDFIKDVDDARSRWVKMVYGEDIDDPALYDVIINLEVMSVADACAIVAIAIEQPEFTLTDTVRAGLEDFRVASLVRVALARSDETRALSLDVDVRGEAVEISGQAPLLKADQMGDRITEVARSVPGVGEVNLKVQWFDPYP